MRISFSRITTSNCDIMQIVSVNDKVERRTANYKPNIWNYDRLQSTLTSKYDEEKYKREAEALKEEVSGILGSLMDPLNKLELIDDISKLALSYYFEEEISETLNEIAYMKSTHVNNDLYATAVCFRILRQYGYNVSQDAFVDLIHEEFTTSAHLDDKTKVEILECSHLAALEDDQSLLLDIAKSFTTKNLSRVLNSSNNDDQDHIKHAIADDKIIYNCPLHWSVSWFNVKKHIQYSNINNYSILLPLARLSFNMVQALHQNELKEILRHALLLIILITTIWWRNLGLSEVLTFTRDRVVESFLWAVGVAYEPQYGSLRKWLTKAIVLVLIIDDVYDIYGSKQELEQFTTAVERWDPREIQKLPEAIKKCFSTLYDTANDIDNEIQKEKGWNSVLPHIKKVWSDFCKALLVEAKWYHAGRTPSLREYLDNGWTSSSGPVLSIHILFGVGQHRTQTISILNNSLEIIRHVSLIIRLCNDKGTSKAELERGDAPSSILCYMRESNVGEEESREHIGKIVTRSWKETNGLFISSPHCQQPMIRYVINAARVANFIYQNGDGFGVQDRETREQVLSCLIDPLPLAFDH
ncbi:hypothetical protein BUALT_Bualt03G0070700 [Buddleja alternifolia]|uniref:Uncharacterized protein n=1 Tax=Buddleja alternifolia TaxID=168488 RepID=A0AAV6XZ46_9LAMI|nr:hypothetical protein BUALT_Bualt03G0070700 [Buddleja alternifolia]